MSNSNNNSRQSRPPYTAMDLAQIHGASGINILAGIWLLIAPIYLGYSRPISRWNDIIVGAVLVAFATLRYVHPLGRFWVSWINSLVGIWLIAAPFVLHCDVLQAQTNDITVGLIVAIAGAISGSVRSFGR